ncbi:MAG: ArnT family glycosyltransferase [Spirochaetota bacterium]
MEKSKIKIFSDSRFFFPLLFILIFLLRISGLYQGVLDIDETVFAEFANKLLGGALPYSGVFDNKPPAVYYFFAAVFSVAGLSNLSAVHAVTMLIVFLTAVLVYFAARRSGGNYAAAAAALFYVLMTHTYEPKYISTNGEILINLPLSLSVLCYCLAQSGKKRSAGCLFVSGISLGVAVLVSYKAGLCAAVFAADTLFRGISSRNAGSFFREMAVLAAVGFSSIIPIAASVFYFYNAGILPDFINWGFLYNFSYVDAGAASTPLWKTSLRTGLFLLCTLPAWIAVGLLLFKSKASGAKEEPRRILWIWLAVSFAAALLGGRTYGHYFIQIAPAASILAGISCAYLAERKKGKALIRFFWIYSSVLMIVFFVSRIDFDATYRLIRYDNWKAQPSFKAAGEYVKARSSPDDTVYVWGWGTPVYIYSDRRCSSKVLVANYVSGKSFGSSTDYTVAMDRAFLSAMRDDFMKEMKAAPPALFLDTSPSGLFGYDHFPVSVFPELDAFIRRSYRYEATVEGIAVYRRL